MFSHRCFDDKKMLSIFVYILFESLTKQSYPQKTHLMKNITGVPVIPLN